MSTHNLYGHSTNGTAATLRTIETLVAYCNIKLVAHLENFIIIELPFSHQYAWYTLCDNGGEVNVEKINFLESLISVGYSSTQQPALAAEMMAYRIWCACTGQRIDYELVDVPPFDKTKCVTLDLLYSTRGTQERVYVAYEVHPCVLEDGDGRPVKYSDPAGKTFVQCEENDPNLATWCLYGVDAETGELYHLDDFETKAEAEAERDRRSAKLTPAIPSEKGV